MGGRHQAKPAAGKSRRGLILVGVVLALLLVVGGGVYAVTTVTGRCDSVTEYTVAADPAIAGAVSEFVQNTDPSDLGCASFAVAERDSASLPTPGEGAPDLWIPNSTFTVARASAAGTEYPILRESLASTPIVVASRSGEQIDFATWLEVVRVQGLRLGDPQWDAVSAGPIVGALAEAESSITDANAVLAALVSLAQSQATDGPLTSTDARLLDVSARGGIAVTTEEDVVHGSGLAAVVPASGSVFLDFPLVATAGDDSANAAGTALADALASNEGIAALNAAGLRGADRAPLPDGQGAGDVAALTVEDTAGAAQTLSKYSILAKPSRALVVQDVSGSMNYQAGDVTRARLAAEAAETGTRLFPNSAQLGLWFFSTSHNGPTDYTEIVPIRRLDAEVNGLTQRERLVEGIRTLPASIGGGTALYDSTLAAFREVQKGYDPAYVNSVILLTDGANEDIDSIALSDLLAAIKEEQDPTRPVIIVTIGLTEDADAQVLEQISAAAHGSSYVARTPAQIPTVFVDALESRTG